MEETSNKVISLAIAAFDPSDKDRHDILIRAVQCTKYILDENRLDSSQAVLALISCNFTSCFLSYEVYLYFSNLVLNFQKIHSFQFGHFH